MSVNPFNKILLIVALVLAVGTGVAIAAGTNGGSSSDPATTVVDVKGPCDEAEHANDPECAGAQVPEDNDADEQGEDRNDDHGRGRDHAEDDSAEAEDQNDDHGQGADDAAEAEDPNDDKQGQNDDQGENEQDDDSGPSANSGPGSSHDSGDDDSGDGHSGHGGGDDGGDD
jgi:hypothetical protein